MAEKSSKHEANVQFDKIQRANDAKSATAEYETAAAATRAKTARLKALRLARDAATPAPPPAAPKRKAKAKSTATLETFLDGATKDGRNG
jgi:transcription elongation GreA/GreB family factor